MTTTGLNTRQPICIDRKMLLKALGRMKWVLPSRSPKPILLGVRLSASGSELRLAGTDLETSLIVRVAAEGELPDCVVPCQELTRRVKATRTVACSLQFDVERDVLVINGGRVEHAVRTLELAEFPGVASESHGEPITVQADEFHRALTIALTAAATQPSRYAISGVLLESDKAGSRVVATDGCRLVVCDLQIVKSGFRGAVILPKNLASLASRLVDPKDPDALGLFIKPGESQDGNTEPADIFLIGPDWLAHSQNLDGIFPRYREVIPASSSKFIADRRQLLETVETVSLATSFENKGGRLDLSARSVTVSAGSAEVGESTGSVPAEFAGGGDDRIITAFNPGFLQDALKTLQSDRIVIDVAQNTYFPASNAVMGRPALFYGHGDKPSTRWVIMPVRTDLPPSRETLGSNFDPDEKAESSVTPACPESTQSAKTDTSSQDTPRRRRRRVEQVWPEIGTRLDGEYGGETYAALVVAALKLKSGRALQVITGPALGRTFNSMTAAMLAATATQRRKLGQGRSKRGLPKSGWNFWRESRARRASA